MLDCIKQQWPNLERLQTGHTETAKVRMLFAAFRSRAAFFSPLTLLMYK